MLASEMIKEGISTRKCIAEKLRLAAELVEMGGDRDESASWRAIDAMVELKSINMEYSLPGIDNHTGMGGKLTIKQERK